MRRQPLAGVFPLGSHLCREPMPLMVELAVKGLDARALIVQKPA